MAVQTTYPGVYIDEFAPGAPIQGVGTSTAAFLGVAARGEISEATKITSWDQFQSEYGEHPVPGYPLWYAVRGFFENGGTVCYIVRVSDGTYGWIDITAAGVATVVFRVRARRPGALGLQAKIDARHLLQNADTQLYRPTGSLVAAGATATAQEITLGPDGATLAPDVAARFRPGDTITIAAAGRRYVVMRVSGATIRLDQVTGQVYAGSAAVRLADLAGGEQQVRLQTTAPNPLNALVPGAMLTMTQGALHDTRIVESVQSEFLPAGAVTYRVNFRDGITALFSLAAAVTVQSEEFDLTIQSGGTPVPYTALSIDPGHPRFVETIVNGDDTGPVRVTVTDPPPALMPPKNLPGTMGFTAFTTAGTNETLTGLTDNHYVTALDVLAPVDDVNLVAIPDRTTLPVQQAIITHCLRMGDRFGVLDAQPGLPLFGTGSIETQRAGVEATRGFAALYYPWIRVRPAVSGGPILVPPSGHVCGIMARSDQSRGVHKAPANEIVGGALGVERNMSDVDQGLLNMEGINVIRVFAGGPPTLWGARTTTRDTNWQYVSTRRLFLYLEESIEEGIRYGIFEPNDLALWQKLKRSITDFLLRAWRDGALFGATREDAFYVRIDETLNPFSEQQLGRLYIEIGVRPAYPAEFIIVRIGIWAGGKDVEEG